MYPIPPKREDVYNFYCLAFDEHGCPMKKVGEKLIFQPIYPPYLICDYLNSYISTKDKKYLNYAEEIMDKALDRAEDFNDALVFYYHPEDKLTIFSEKFYSALTQAWYIKALCKISKFIPNKYDQTIKQVFNSLLIPLDKGGVLLKEEDGWSIEEYPHNPPLYTLNGWMSALKMVIQSANQLEKLNIDYQKFLNLNFLKLKKLLPLYDAKFCFNSRYQLTGFTRLKLVIAPKNSIFHFIFRRNFFFKLKNLFITIPTLGDYPVLPQKAASRWHNYIERKEKNILILNIVQSLISFPKENLFHANIFVNKQAVVQIFLADGDYQPKISGMATTKWRKVAKVELAKGQNTVSEKLSFDSQNLFAYPTNFAKKIKGKFYNVYHFVHIIDLCELYRFSKIPQFKEYALLWLNHYKKWRKMPMLKDVEKVQFSSYGNNFESHAMQIMDRNKKINEPTS